MQLIRLEKISMGYISGQEVLHDITFAVNPGEFYFLAGASGVGKSSLLNILAISNKPNSGNLRILGKDTGKMSRSELALMRRKIGTVFQDYRLIEHLNVEENVGLPLKIAGESKKQIAGKVAELREWVGLGAY
ncbi:MAG: ATP-binding cassette domain-containing protein, partial [Pseudomonadota bacterium]